MDIKNLKDIDFNDICVSFAVKKRTVNKKPIYITETTAKTDINKTIELGNLTLRDILFYLGERTCSTVEMNNISQYVFEKNKKYLSKFHEEITPDTAGYFDFVCYEGKQEIHLHDHLGYTRLDSLDELLEKTNEFNKNYITEKNGYSL